jgi:poly-gamma-glutamate synthesis protein (capsule biosynthesis protein)
MASGTEPRAASGRAGFPRGRLVAAGALVVFALLLIAAVAVRRDGRQVAGASGGAARPSAAAGRDATAGGTTTRAGDTPSTEPRSSTTAWGAGRPESFTLAFAGDLLPHLPLDRQAAAYGGASGQPYDFRPMLAPMAPVIGAADVAICHMETPIAPDQSRIAGYPAFAAPAELADGAKSAGYDGCSTASNHSLDQGRDGIAATLDRFDAVGLRHAGTARTAEEGASITTYDVGGVKVAHLSYAYDFNGYKIPSDAPWAVNQIDGQRIRDDAHRAREAGADFVVVSCHWGTEYQHDPNQYQRDVASQILPSPDIDLVVGHHAHVVQPIGQVGGTYVVWGLGNQLANQPETGRSDGLTAVVTVSRGVDGTYHASGIQAVPTYIEPGTFRVLPISRTLADPATPPGLRADLEASYHRTEAVLATSPTVGVTLTPLP